MDVLRYDQNVMLIGMANKISKSTHISVWITLDATESREPINQILVYTFSLGALDSVVS